MYDASLFWIEDQGYGCLGISPDPAQSSGLRQVFSIGKRRVSGSGSAKRITLSAMAFAPRDILRRGVLSRAWAIFQPSGGLFLPGLNYVPKNEEFSPESEGLSGDGPQKCARTGLSETCLVSRGVIS